jgi:hypothetical protein
MVDTIKPLANAFAKPADFSIREVTNTRPAVGVAAAAVLQSANLGPLAAFTGTFAGRGFNTIFRPDSTTTPTPMPGPVHTTDPADNVLELNVTAETLSFSNPLGSVPNRGSKSQADIFLNGVPYLQTVDDITTGTAIGIHLEPGIWLQVPATTNPSEPITVARLASIPHGTTILAQGVTLVPAVAGKPNIAAVDITPFVGGQPAQTVVFQSQTATNKTTRRIPQDLSAEIASGSITQAILSDPNTVLRNQIANQTITQTITLLISTKPGTPLPRGPLAPAPLPAPAFGGGPANIAFLPAQANPPPGGPTSNANTFQMDAVFWIETVVYDVHVPPMPHGTAPITLEPVQKSSVPVVPSFIATIPSVPGKGFAGGVVKVATTQIQYSQKVMLDFAGLSWPHVSVASLVPASPVPIPESLLPLT